MKLGDVMSKENKIKSVDFIKAFISFVFLFVVNVFFVLSGLLFVALGIPFRVEGFSVSDGRRGIMAMAACGHGLALIRHGHLGGKLQ